MVKKWQQYYNEVHTNDNDSSDDEPIQKYAKNYDSGIDLSDDIKLTIRTEVARVMKLKIPDAESRKKKVSPPLAHPQKRTSDADKNPKKQKLNFIDLSPFSSAPEVAFADVNEVHSVGTSNQILDVKTEIPCTFPSNIEGNYSYAYHKFYTKWRLPTKIFLLITPSTCYIL